MRLTKKISLFSYLFIINSFIWAADPINFELSIPTQPNKINIKGACQDGSNNTFKITLNPSSAIPTPLLESLQDNLNNVDVPETINCQDLIHLIKQSDYNWISHTTPSFPIDTKIAIYSFVPPKQNTHWLLLKDQGKSTDTSPFYQLFIWKNKKWTAQPDPFKELSFYGFENGYAITGAYEGPYFIKLISEVKGSKLSLVRKEMWQDDQMVFSALPHEKGKPLSEYRQNASEVLP
jgi:hypothetical protein